MKNFFLVLAKFSSLLILCALISGCAVDLKPPYTNYCEMIARDIAGKKHGFLAGNLMNYVGGQSNADYEIIEHETIGFTHPLFDDTRSRGLGIVTNENGTGHDFGSWEFYRYEKVAYGTVIIDGREFINPKPLEMVWRPDRQVCRYEIGDAIIEETKFITNNDVLVCMINSSKPVELRFEGQSFFMEGELPEYYSNPPGTPFMLKTESQASYDKANQCLQILEAGRVMTRTAHEQGIPSVEGDFVYNGMSKVITSSKDFSETVQIEEKENGQQLYKFSLLCDKQGIVLTYAMDDNYDLAIARSQKILNDPAAALEAKTKFMNDLLNEQIPYFRCSDEKVVETYYYLWALNFMYFREVGKGYTPYPYTVTAINNFRTLFMFDAVNHIAMGTWVADKQKWAYGNILNMKSMQPFIKNGNIPETFGATWWSPVYASVLEYNVNLTWLTYQRGGDLELLKEIYPFYKAVYLDKGFKNGSNASFQHISAIHDLHRMADALGKKVDADEWLSLKEKLLEEKPNQWEVDTPNYYGSGKLKDVWNLSAFYSPEMPDEWVEAMTNHWVINSEKGFFGAVPLKIRAFDSKQIPPFNVNTINTWLAAEGLFRHHVDKPAIDVTLGHFAGMVKDYGCPVAPECWDESDKPWGSAYYAWDNCIALLPVERLAGVDYSMINNSFTVCDHLPERWDFVETIIPVVKDGITHWTKVKVERKKEGENVKKTISVTGNVQPNLTIEPWLEGKELVSSIPSESMGTQPRGHNRYELGDVKEAQVTVTLK